MQIQVAQIISWTFSGERASSGIENDKTNDLGANYIHISRYFASGHIADPLSFVSCVLII